jgi:hypothetical protein
MRFRILFLWAFLPLTLFAQKRNYNWVFGEHMWMSFANDTVSFLPLADTISAHNASISDTLGDLALVADDHGIRNGALEFVQGGMADELGWPLRTGLYLILPKPGNADRYFVFLTTGENSKQAGAVEVDVSAAGGQGAVVGNTNWFAQNVTSKLAATPHANGTDYWVLLHEDGTDLFMAFSLSAAGISPDPVDSHVDAPLLPTLGTTTTADFWGQIKFSVQGDRLALFRNTDHPDTLNVSVFHFDDTSGALEHWCTWDNFYQTVDWEDTVESYLPLDKFGGLEFDRTGRFLYPCESGLVIYSRGMQIDLEQVSADGRTGPAWTALAYNGEVLSDSLGSQIQLGPDGQLYWRPATHFADSSVILYSQELPTLAINTGASSIIFDFPPNTKIYGLPSPCKRYHDSPVLYTGIHVMDEAKLPQIYPNPTSSTFTLALNGRSLNGPLLWVDATGRVVRTEQPTRSGMDYILERGSLQAGLYTLLGHERGALVLMGRVMLE